MCRALSLVTWSRATGSNRIAELHIGLSPGWPSWNCYRHWGRRGRNPGPTVGCFSELSGCTIPSADSHFTKLQPSREPADRCDKTSKIGHWQRCPCGYNSRTIETSFLTSA